MPSPFNWNPPEWKTGAAKPDLTTDPGSLPYVQIAAPSFNNPDKPPGPGGTPKLNGGDNFKFRVNNLITNTTHQNNHFVAIRPLEPALDDDTGATLTKVSHPRSDFRHVDPGFNAAGFQPAIAAMRNLENPAKADGEANKAMKQALPSLKDLDAMLVANPRGMQRLKLVSDHHMVRIITLFGEINLALAGAGNPGAYKAARDEYIELLNDIDNREPDPVNDIPGKRGYGRCVQWFYVKPIIHQADGQIKGAVVQAKWNPHISSSGVPIPHL